MINPWRELLLDQFGNRRTRDQYTLINIKIQARKPRLPGDVSCRFSLMQPQLVVFQHGTFFFVRQAAVKIFITEVRRQMQRRQAQVHGLVQCIRHTVGETQPGLVELAHSPSHQVADGMQLTCYCANIHSLLIVTRKLHDSVIIRHFIDILSQI